MVVTANNVLDMLNANWDAVSASYPRIEQFNKTEIQAFLTNNAEADTKRNHQVCQAVSAIGARKVDAKLADKDTVVVYKALWNITASCKCQYCKKTVSYSLMFGNNGVCLKARCQLQYMRDSL